MAFARDNGCNTVMLTGDGEPQLNTRFLDLFSEWNEKLDSPFRWIELQTAGTALDEEKLRWLRNTVGVNMISLSLSDVFDDESNGDMNGAKVNVKIEELCAEIKRYDFSLRLSLNMTHVYDGKIPAETLTRCSELGADQVTFRKLYESGSDSRIDRDIKRLGAHWTTLKEIQSFIESKGRRLEQLPFGAWRYSIDGMSVVLDNDCMSQEGGEAVKYLILQPNCKLYTKWDDRGSLLF